MVAISAAIEAEIAALDADDRKEFLEALRAGGWPCAQRPVESIWPPPKVTLEASGVYSSGEGGLTSSSQQHLFRMVPIAPDKSGINTVRRISLAR